MKERNKTKYAKTCQFYQHIFLYVGDLFDNTFSETEKTALVFMKRKSALVLWLLLCNVETTNQNEILILTLWKLHDTSQIIFHIFRMISLLKSYCGLYLLWLSLYNSSNLHNSSTQSWRITDSILEITFDLPWHTWLCPYEWAESNGCFYVWLTTCKISTSKISSKIIQHL